jgi:hypothetical protein
VKSQNWRIVSTSAQRLEAKPEEFVPLKSADKGSACAKLGSTQASTYVQPGFNVSGTYTYEHNDYCYLIIRGNPPALITSGSESGKASASSSTRAITSGTVVPRDEILIAVYQTPGPDVADSSNRPDPTPIAGLQFGRYEKDQNRWYVGVAGPHKGWIALLRPTRLEGESYFGSPASTDALVNLAQDVLRKHQPTAPMQARQN